MWYRWKRLHRRRPSAQRLFQRQADNAFVEHSVHRLQSVWDLWAQQASFFELAAIPEHAAWHIESLNVEVPLLAQRQARWKADRSHWVEFRLLVSAPGQKALGYRVLRPKQGRYLLPHLVRHQLGHDSQDAHHLVSPHYFLLAWRLVCLYVYHCVVHHQTGLPPLSLHVSRPAPLRSRLLERCTTKWPLGCGAPVALRLALGS